MKNVIKRGLRIAVVGMLFQLGLSNPAFSQDDGPPPEPPAPAAPAPETVKPGESAPPAAVLPPTPKETSGIPSDEDRFDGDHLRLYVNVDDFKLVSDPESQEPGLCAPKGSVVVVTRDDGETISLRFTSVLDEKDHFLDRSEKKALESCAAEHRVNEATQYVINKQELLKYSFSRSGVTFGGLVVPFKVFLGDDKKISPSSTIAPYIGFRGPAPFGLTFTPVFSAGLGLVPVTDPDTDETETKAAFSTAVGLVLSSSKNDTFNAGLIFGKDFLSRSDRKSDPDAGDIWFSVYVGYSM